MLILNMPGTASSYSSSGGVIHKVRL